MENPLVSVKASDTDQVVALHPLVLLTASDFITRHRLRKLDGPPVGIILGRQNGREILAEHAFIARISDGQLDQKDDWTARRIQQFKDVHKNPALDVVGWFTFCSKNGLLPEHAALQRQIISTYSENSILLALHSTALNAPDGANGKLPVTVYESFFEADQVPDDGKMQVDGADNPNIKFRAIPFTVETDEAEMIAINYVAKGAGSAAAVAGADSGISQTDKASSKGKQKIESSASPSTVDEKVGSLTAEEEDEIAGITTRLNSVRMLQSRLQLMSRFVQSTPASYASDQRVPLDEKSPNPDHLPHLRNIQALITRLSLLTPAGQDEPRALLEAGRSQSNDVALAAMLSCLGQEVQGLSELGRKFQSVEQGRNSKSKSKGGFGTGTYGGMEEHDAGFPGLLMNSGTMV